MNAVKKIYQDVSTPYSIMFQQIILHTQPIFTNLWDSLYYMREVTIHTMDYIDAATTGVLSTHVLPIEDLREMLSHIELLPPCTYHFHQKMHFISTDIYTPTS